MAKVNVLCLFLAVVCGCSSSEMLMPGLDGLYVVNSGSQHIIGDTGEDVDYFSDANKGYFGVTQDKSTGAVSVFGCIGVPVMFADDDGVHCELTCDVSGDGYNSFGRYRSRSEAKFTFFEGGTFTADGYIARSYVSMDGESTFASFFNGYVISGYLHESCVE